MNFLGRLCGAVALSLFLSPVLSAAEPPRPKAKAKKTEAARTEASPRKAETSPAGSPLHPVTPAPQAMQDDQPVLRPLPATLGTLGLFTLESGETLPRRAAAFSAYVNKFSREPGSASIVNVGWNVSYGIADWVSTYLVFEPHRHVHVSRPARLSFNAPGGNPQFGTTMYRSLTSVPGSAPGYIEDFPFVGRNGGGIGEFTLGLKFGLLSERRGKPVNLAVRSDFILPTRTSLSDLLGVQNQNGVFDFNVGLALSKTFHNLLMGTFNWNYRFTRDPEFDGVKALVRADQMRAGVGFLAFPEKRMQLMAEFNGLVFMGEHTPTTTFGARDPFEVIAGVRLYPWRNVGVDLGYRNTANLKAHGDRNGFVVKLGYAYWPAPPKPANRAPVAACAADKATLFAESGDVVAVSVRASDPDGDPLNVAWDATGGRVEGTGPSVNWHSAGTAPGIYTLTARVDDAKGGTASCSVDVRVEPRPNRAPSLTCSADRTTVLVGERVRITGEAADADGDPLQYAWQTNGGQIVGEGAAVQLDTSGVAPGLYTVTGRVEDGRGGAADCSTEVTVQAPPPPPQSAKMNECFFRAASARVDNVCKRILDDVALRLQNDPRATVVIVGYADPKEPRPERLATQRAEASRAYLGEKGIAATRVEVRAAGGQAGAGKQNHRVDLIWVPEGATF